MKWGPERLKRQAVGDPCPWHPGKGAPRGWAWGHVWARPREPVPTCEQFALANGMEEKGRSGLPMIPVKLLMENSHWGCRAVLPSRPPEARHATTGVPSGRPGPAHPIPQLSSPLPASVSPPVK